MNFEKEITVNGESYYIQASFTEADNSFDHAFGRQSMTFNEINQLKAFCDDLEVTDKATLDLIFDKVNDLINK